MDAAPLAWMVRHKALTGVGLVLGVPLLLAPVLPDPETEPAGQVQSLVDAPRRETASPVAEAAAPESAAAVTAAPEVTAVTAVTTAPVTSKAPVVVRSSAPVRQQVAAPAPVRTTAPPTAVKPAATRAPTETRPPAQPSAKDYDNCDHMHEDYPGGVSEPGAVDKRSSGTAKYAPHVSQALYDANTESDRDQDGIACEQ